MRIKVGNTWFEPTVDAPAMVVLTPKEKQDIGSMSPDATMYAVFADDCAMSSNERLAWMTQPAPATTPEGRYALIVGHPIPIHQADTVGVDEPPKRRNSDLATAILKQLTTLSVGSCSCGVKSPDVHWHDAGCKYRLYEEIRENVEALEEGRADQWRLRRDAEASRDVARSACDTMRQERDVALSHPEPAAQEAVAEPDYLAKAITHLRAEADKAFPPAAKTTLLSHEEAKYTDLRRAIAALKARMLSPASLLRRKADER